MKIRKRIGLKRFIISLLITGVLVYLAAPIYSKSQNKIISENKIARIDIQNKGSKDTGIKFLSANNHSKPDWCKKENGSCSILSEKISNKWKKIDVKFKAVKDGNVTIYLRSPYKKDNKNNIYKMLVDYKDFSINGKNIFKKQASFWHNEPYKYSIKAKDGEVIKFSVQAKKPSSDWNNVDRLMLLSVLILAFLLSYKLVQYVAKFKIIENNSRIDIVFVITFIILLFLPMSHISNATKSMQENRMLAKYPKFFTDSGINNKFGTQFENWYNDRFFGREQQLYLHNKIKYTLSKYMRNNDAVKAPDDTIFALGKIKKIHQPLSENIMRKISGNVSRLQKFAEKNNIDLYILFPPSKEDVYSQELSDYYADLDNNFSSSEQLKEYLMYHNHIDVVYPRDIYLQPHKDFTHYKTDHHWTEYGAFLGYKELMKEIKKKHQEITILEESDFDVFYKNLPRPGGYTKDFQRSFNKGSDCRRLGITDDCPLEYAYKYYNHKDMKNKRIKKGPLPSSYITEYEKGTDKKVTIVGNSYGGYLMEFLPFTFKNVQWLRTNNNQSGVKNYEDMRRFEKHIVDFNTDILIYYMASPYVLHLQDMY